MADRGFKNRTGQRRVAVILLTSLLLMATVWYSTAKPESTPVGTNTSLAQNLATSGSPTVHSAFAPFLDIVPSQDGTDLFISAGGVGELDGTVFANIGIGPGADKGSWMMTPSEADQAYVATATGFTPNTDISGQINITTTLNQATEDVDYTRAHVLPPTPEDIFVEELRLSLVNTNTIATEAYIAVVRSYGPPGPAPAGHGFVGGTYSVRASGALTVTDKPMNLRLYYDSNTLTGADPHTLAIFSWDAHNERWDELGGWLFQDMPGGDYLSVTTHRFTTYALMTTPAWCDDFWNSKGLSAMSDVTVGSSEVKLSSDKTSGWATSNPITPTIPFDTWHSLTFACTVDPPTTTLTVDVLSLDGTKLLADVTSGVSLADLDPAQYPTLKLRATLSSTVTGKTPTLDAWQLTWQVKEHKVYLPVVLK